MWLQPGIPQSLRSRTTLIEIEWQTGLGLKSKTRKGISFMVKEGQIVGRYVVDQVRDLTKRKPIHSGEESFAYM